MHIPLLQVKVKGPRYWELSVDLSKDTEHLRSDSITAGPTVRNMSCTS